MTQYKTIAESNNFIVLEQYTRDADIKTSGSYQTEADLERELIQDLMHLGYEKATHITTQETMLANVRTQLQLLNNVSFTNNEWARFVEEYLDKLAKSSKTIIEI